MRRIVACLAAATVALASCTYDDGLEATPGEPTVRPGDAGPDSQVPDMAIGGTLLPDGCPFPEPDSTQPDCYRLEVPAAWDDPSLGDISVQVAVFPATQRPPEGTVLWIEGGPGVGPLDGVSAWFDLAFGDISTSHDVVLYDPRGTGFSRPSLDCPEIDELFDTDEVVPIIAEARAADDCATRLALEGIDLSHYGTLSAARDLEALRKALGVDRWDIWGQSYGTRMAQTYAREFGGAVRSMVLDGAYSIADDPDDDYTTGGAEALEAFLSLCASQNGCAQRYPDLGRRIDELIARADDEPIEVDYLDPDDGSTAFTYTMSGQDILSTFYGALYSDYTAASIPQVVDDLENSVTWSLDLLASQTGPGSGGEDYAAFVAVQCMDEWSYISPELDVDGRFGDLQSSSNAYWSAVCTALDLQDAPPVEDQFVALEQPALVLSGSFDPITPHREAVEFADQLGAQLVLFPRSGHGQLGVSACAASLAAEFTRSVGEVDASCANADVAPMIPEAPAVADFFEIALEHPAGAAATALVPAGWVGYGSEPFDGYAIRDRHLVDVAGFTIDLFDDGDSVDSHIEAVVVDWLNTSVGAFELTGGVAVPPGWVVLSGATDDSPVARGTPALITLAAGEVAGDVVVLSVFGTPDDHQALAKALIETMVPALKPAQPAGS